MARMQSIVALLAARTHGRFILPAARHRQALLGLRRAGMRTVPTRGRRGAVASVEELRDPRTQLASSRPAAAARRLGSPSPIHWTRSTGPALRPKRRGIAAPWRG